MGVIRRSRNGDFGLVSSAAMAEKFLLVSYVDGVFRRKELFWSSKSLANPIAEDKSSSLPASTLALILFFNLFTKQLT